nr:hypothetical protein SHINE37_70408 [Rhizobiaceae bacterium]
MRLHFLHQCSQPGQRRVVLQEKACFGFHVRPDIDRLHPAHPALFYTRNGGGERPKVRERLSRTILSRNV